MGSRASRRVVRLRLVLEQPVAGVVYSLQDKQGRAAGATLSAGDDLVFEVEVEVDAAGRFFGAFVRSEGATRQFVYVASGQAAGQAGTSINRRMKIDISGLSSALLDAARAGATLQAVFAGSSSDGGPACATCRPVEDWRAT